jgi:hypothetical protein
MRFFGAINIGVNKYKTVQMFPENKGKTTHEF